jgi:hypothetical protein
LIDPLVVPPGVTLAGAGPHLTVLSGQGLSAAVVINNGGTPGQPALQSLTVSGAAVGVQVEDGHDVELRNVILRDNQEAGLRVLANARASLINGTVVRNGVGIDVEGAASIRNGLVTANGIGLSAASGGTIATSYSDVAENTTADRQGVDVGSGDLAVVVQFVAASDWRLAAAQGTTDHNIGAFGNTPFAEQSAPSTALGPQSGGGLPAAETQAGTSSSPGGGGCALAMGRRSGSAPEGLALMALFMTIASRRRRSR